MQSYSINKNAQDGNTQLALQSAPSKAYGSKRIQFILIVCAQFLMTVAFALPHAYTLYTGKVITLKTTPVDPCDIFRGEYANLGYEGISQCITTIDFHSGQQVYAVLKSSKENVWTIKSIAKEAPKIDKDELLLKGEIAGSPSIWSGGKYSVRINYGIERLYLPEGRSLYLQNNAKALKVDLAVGPGGDAVIKHVSFNEKRLYDGANMFDPFS